MATRTEAGRPRAHRPRFLARSSPKGVRAAAHPRSRRNVVRLARKWRDALRLRRRHPHGAGRARCPDRRARHTWRFLGRVSPRAARPARRGRPLSAGCVLMAAATLSALERIKAASRGLRGTIVESLADPVTGGIAE